MEILQKSRRSKSLVGKTNLHGSSDQSENGNTIQSGPIDTVPTYRSGFLNYRFKGKTLAYIDELRGATDPVPPTIVENLEESFAFYAGLIGKDQTIVYPEDLNYHSKVQFLFEKLRRMVPKRYGINIEYLLNGKFAFVLFRGYDWPQTLFYIPMDFLLITKRSNSRLYRTFLSWVRFISNQLEIPLWDENGIAEQMEMLKFQAVELIGTGDKEYQSRAEDIKSHLNLFIKGPWMDYLHKVRTKRPTLGSITSQLNKCKMSLLLEDDLIELMKKGIEFVKESKRLSSYGYNPYHESGEERTLGLHYTFGFAWSLDDAIFEEFNNFLNIQARQADFIETPVQFYPLIEENQKPFEDDNWPLFLKAWLNDLASTINLYKLKYSK